MHFLLVQFFQMRSLFVRASHTNAYAHARTRKGKRSAAGRKPLLVVLVVVVVVVVVGVVVAVVVVVDSW